MKDTSFKFNGNGCLSVSDNANFILIDVPSSSRLGFSLRGRVPLFEIWEQGPAGGGGGKGGGGKQASSFT